VRFETNAGNFDLMLNPTGNVLLQGYVDNFLQYVTSGRYDSTVINRADEGFLLQMGIFKVAGPDVPDTVSGFTPIEPFPPVMGVPAAEVPGLSNTVGAVGLALSSGAGGANQDSGTSSFYINVGDNSILDNDFTVFAQVADMAPINAVMALSQFDLTAIPGFGAGPNDIGFTDVPVLSNGDLVVISRAFVVPEPSSWTLIGALGSAMLGIRLRRIPKR
jgi:cyclophilin family peptidyl-prolyl cis-trans isomerase